MLAANRLRRRPDEQLSRSAAGATDGFRLRPLVALSCGFCPLQGRGWVGMVPDVNRRKALKVLVSGMGLAGAGVVGGSTLVTAVAPAARSGGSAWRRVGQADGFEVGAVRLAPVERTAEEAAAGLLEKGVYVWRQSTERFVVFSRSCTDLSCPITHDPGSGWFFCPCHGGIFDEEGEPRAGPPSRPLYRYAARVSDGHLEIELRSVPAHV